MCKKFGTVIRCSLSKVTRLTNLKPNIMKLNSTKTIKAPGAKMMEKTKSRENIYSLAILIFSMIGVSTVLQLVFLA